MTHFTNWSRFVLKTGWQARLCFSHSSYFWHIYLNKICTNRNKIIYKHSIFVIQHYKYHSFWFLKDHRSTLVARYFNVDTACLIIKLEWLKSYRCSVLSDLIQHYKRTFGKSDKHLHLKKKKNFFLSEQIQRILTLQVTNVVETGAAGSQYILLWGHLNEKRGKVLWYTYFLHFACSLL